MLGRARCSGCAGVVVLVRLARRLPLASPPHVHPLLRLQLLKLQAENDSLKIQEIEDRRKIQHLLTLTEPLAPEVCVRAHQRAASSPLRTAPHQCCTSPVCRLCLHLARQDRPLPLLAAAAAGGHHHLPAPAARVAAPLRRPIRGSSSSTATGQAWYLVAAAAVVVVLAAAMCPARLAV